MWFVLLAIALAVVTVGGLYFRRRVLEALTVVGVSRRVRRWTGWAILWLLFGVPVLTFVFVVASLALGRDSVMTSVTGPIEWLVIAPFWFSILVMLQAVPYLLLVDGLSLVWRRRPWLRRFRALGCFAAVAAFAIYTPLRIAIERSALDVNEYTIGDGKGPPLRIAFVADLQLDHHTDETRAAEVVSVVNDWGADLVLVGGDWINTGAEYIDVAGRVGGAFKSRLGTSSVRGDHEHFAYRDQQRSVNEVTASLAAHGVEMIDNEVRWIDHHGARVALIYLSYNYIQRATPKQIRRLLDEASSADTSILITHQFDNALAKIARDRVDVALVAHTHGGQVNPVVGVVHVPLARVETPYIAGRYEVGETTLIVTSGIGFSIAPFRYASRPSIELIELSR